MALSRIWSAFILISILVAVFKFAACGEKQIFSSMVVGKKGDSVQVNHMQSVPANSPTADSLISSGRVGAGELKVRIQAANGIVDTCKDSVTLCIELTRHAGPVHGFYEHCRKGRGH
jgi:hypothetical protein